MQVRSLILAVLGSSSDQGERSQALSLYLEALVIKQGYPRTGLAQELEELRIALQRQGRSGDELLLSFEISRWKPSPDIGNVARSPLTAEALVTEVRQHDFTEERLFSVVYWLFHGRGMERDVVSNLLGSVAKDSETISLRTPSTSLPT